MKNLFSILIIILVLASCGNTKKVVSTPNNTIESDSPMIVDDKITVSKGRVIAETAPLSMKTETPTLPESSEMPASPIEIMEESDADLEYPDEVEELENETDYDDGIQLISKDTPGNHDAWNTLLVENVSADGIVNYAGLKKNRKALLDYINTLGETLPEESWSQEEKLSYWMNAYNAMTVDLILRNQPLESIKDINKPWEQRYWKLGEKYYNLDEIEHQILRKMGDARIHFGINCASFSCPPLLNEAFTPSKVDAQLDKVARKFINDTSRNRISENSVEISKIFDWFAKDFKRNGSIVDYLNQYSTIKISEGAKVRYMDYDWALNK